MKNSGFSIRVFEKEVFAETFFKQDYDHFRFSTQEAEIEFECILLNKKNLLDKHAAKDFEDLIKKLYFARKEFIVSDFEGEFRGFIYDREKSKLFVYTNITSTQRVFYTINTSGIFIDSSLVRLSKTLKNNGISCEPNLNSVYQLLSLGNLLEDQTVLENVLKIPDGSFLDIDVNNGSVEVKTYFSFSGNGYYNNSKDKAIDGIHEIFTEAVLLEYEKDEELVADHLALLSGGLDSRVAMMYAMQNSKRPGQLLCFSHSGYFDETISRKITQDYKLPYEFISLDGGSFLKKVDQLVEISEGCGIFVGGVHVQHALDHLQYQNFKIFHSGQIGDGILGGFLSEPARKKPSTFKIVSRSQFVSKIRHQLDEILSNYESEEIFLLKNLAYNRTVLGAQVLQQRAYQTSPFMTKDFIGFALSLPEEWKYKHKFYIEWITRHCKEATDYRWERTLMKPDAAWKTNFGDKFLKRGFVFLNEKILNTPEKASMYPYQFYFDSSREIQNYYSDYFDENFDRLAAFPELSKDVAQLFESHKFSDKSAAVNVLAIFKLFFGK